MTAQGREMDILVARLLGYTVEHYAGAYYHLLDSQRNEAVRPYEYCATEAAAWEFVPEFSENIADAWSLVEYLRGQGYVMSISANDYVTEPWDCRFFDNQNKRSGKRAIAHGATAAAAIVAAFLKVMK